MTSRALTAFLLCILVATTLAAPKPWVLRFDGAGPVRIGMTLDQLNAALHENIDMPDDEDGKACFYAESAKHPGIAFMVQIGPCNASRRDPAQYLQIGRASCRE